MQDGDQVNGDQGSYLGNFLSVCSSFRLVLLRVSAYSAEIGRLVLDTPWAVSDPLKVDRRRLVI